MAGSWLFLALAFFFQLGWTVSAGADVVPFASPKRPVDQMELLQKFKELPDLARQLEARFPSLGMGISGLNDGRIDQLAKENPSPFKLGYRIAGQGALTYILVDPRRRSGFLWWKKILRVTLDPVTLLEVEAKRGAFPDGVEEFLEGL